MQALGLVWPDWHDVDPGATETARTLPAPRHFGAKFLHSGWSQHRAAGGLTIGRHIPSRAFAPVMRNLVVLEPVPDEMDFRVRISGTALLRRYGFDIRGMQLTQLVHGEPFKKRYIELKSVIRRTTPLSRDVTIANGSRPPLHFETLDVPANAPDGQPLVLSGLFFHDWTG